MSNLHEIINYIRTLDYPHEKLPNISLALDEVRSFSGVRFVKGSRYIYLSKFKRAKKLGVFVINRDKLVLSNAAAAHYTMKAHVQSRRCDFISPYQYWQEHREEVLQLAEERLRRYLSDYTPEELPVDLGGTGGERSHIALQHECAMALVRIGMPASFPANLMVFMIGDIPNLRVLDISAGWGDRLMAACAMGCRYMACDPNTALTVPYEAIIARHGNGKQKVHTLPFEDLPEKTDEKFNCLYSSPPFFDLEIYTTEETQSSHRYETLDRWLNDFLKVCLRKADKMLERGAYIYLHLNDIDVKARYENGVAVTKDRMLNYVEHIVNYVSREFGWHFEGNYGFAIQDKEDKPSETAESRSEKNKTMLVPTRYVRTYREGIRCNSHGDMLTQPIWFFIKD